MWCLEGKAYDMYGIFFLYSSNYVWDGSAVTVLDPIFDFALIVNGIYLPFYYIINS
jgi:hypothetical protein